jgi:hypothetical protein
MVKLVGRKVRKRRDPITVTPNNNRKGLDPEFADAVIYDEQYIETAFARLEALPHGSPEYQAELAEAASRVVRSRDPYALALREHQRALPDLIPAYERMRQQLAECRRVDEAEQIRDGPEATGLRSPAPRYRS